MWVKVMQMLRTELNIKLFSQRKKMYVRERANEEEGRANVWCEMRKIG
jgi:hypothetical protein